MVFLQAIFAFIIQAAGRILNTVFGWVIVMLFGKVPANKQLLLTLISLTSVLWALTVIGVVFPRAGTWMISCVRLPEFISDTPIRLAMLPGALFLPLLVGLWGLFLTEKHTRPQARLAKFRQILRGYPFALGLATTLILMLVLMPIMKLQDLMRRCHSEHVPVMIKSEQYNQVVDEIRELLEAQGYSVARVKTTWMLALPTKLLSSFSKAAINAFVANELATLKCFDGEIIVHPCDLVIRGNRSRVIGIQALIVRNLSLSSAYFTWHKEAHEIEDQLRRLYIASAKAIDERNLSSIESQLDAIEERLSRLNVSSDEWNVLYRELLQVRCQVLVMSNSASNGFVTANNPRESKQKQIGNGDRSAPPRKAS